MAARLVGSRIRYKHSKTCAIRGITIFLKYWTIFHIRTVIDRENSGVDCLLKKDLPERADVLTFPTDT